MLITLSALTELIN